MNDKEKLTIDDLKQMVEYNKLSKLQGLGYVGQVVAQQSISDQILEKARISEAGKAMVVGTPGNILPGGGQIQGMWQQGSSGHSTSPFMPSYTNTLPDYMHIQVDLSVEEIKEELDQLAKRMMELRDMLERKMDVPPEKIERRKLPEN
tara:strand:- start:25095 stop:25538 length:444 start_codon:yes stop_codon:yes gene_type:complete